MTREKDRKLNRKAIVDEALSLIEEDGLAALSTRRLAARLGCEAMSLYHHVRNRDELEDEIVGELLGRVGDADAAKPPIERLRASCRAYLDLATRFPNAFLLVATRRWRAERAIATAVALTDNLRAAGVSPHTTLRNARVIGAYLNGAGLALAAWHKEPEALRAPAPGAEALGQRELLGLGAVREDIEHGLDGLIDGIVKIAA